jgi:hypothetical protein
MVIKITSKVGVFFALLILLSSTTYDKDYVNGPYKLKLRQDVLK